MQNICQAKMEIMEILLPFHSETDWEMAQWLIEEDIGKLSGDRLMGIKKALLQYFSAAKF